MMSGPAWDLSDEYSGCDDPQVSTDLAEVDQLLDQVEQLNKQLADDVGTAQQIAKLSQQVNILLGNVSTYANCVLSVDSQHDAALKLRGGLQNYHKRCGDLFEPLSQFVDNADDGLIEKYLADPEVGASEFLVNHSRKRKHENLSLAEESLVNGLSQDGIHAWGNLYDQVAGSLNCEILVDNETQNLGVAQASGLLSSTDDKQRKNAWDGINAAWSTHEESCAAAINAIAGWRLEMTKHRSREKNVHYLDAPVHVNRITKPTLDALLEVAQQCKPLAQRAAKLQARAYAKDGFGPWDLRAPAPFLAKGDGAKGEDTQVPFERAIQLIADAYSEVDPSMGEFVHMMVDKKWVEGTVGGNKTPGAYCTRFARSRTPRVYMTYTGSQSDIVTLAHELGHAFHGWVMRDLPPSQLSYGMSLAETASTFGETLVRDALLAQSQAPQERLNMMWEDMSAFTAYMLNIPTRFDFENQLYAAREARPLRPAELKQMMSNAWENWYGDALAEPDPMFWATKLHFYISGLSFYNFPYLFGYLFSMGVYAKRQQFGADFYPRYIALLQDTGRMTAEDLATKHLSAQLNTPDFWLETVQSMQQRVDDFEILIDELVA